MKPKITYRIIREQGIIIEQQIADLPISSVWEWMRNGQWKQKDFLRWLTVLRVIEPMKGLS